jgi:uncharacterized lipoprotein YmbA
VRARVPATALALLLVLALGACAGPRDHFYTLAAVVPASGDAARAPQAYLTLVVHVPPAIDRAEMIVHTSSDQVLVLEHARWLGLPSDQMRAALGADLESLRPELWIGGAAPAGQQATRITLDIAQMTVTSDHRALLEARWRILEPGGTRETAGAALLVEPLAAGGDEHAAIAAAFSRDVGTLAARLLEALGTH